MYGKIYLVRHGATSLNDDKREKIRGWSDVPLNSHGIKSSKAAAAYLEPRHIDEILTSDLTRAVQTASAVGDATGAKILATKDMRPWDVGNLTGCPVDEIIPDLNRLMANPSSPAPGGEPFNSFLGRWRGLIADLLMQAKEHPEHTMAVVTHSRHMLSLRHVLSGGRMPVEPKGGPEPGSITLLKVSPYHHSLERLI